MGTEEKLLFRLKLLQDLNSNMAVTEPGFPSQHTTTTVTSNTSVQTNIRFDPKYVKTLPGILKCIQAVGSLLGFIFIQASGTLAYHSTGSVFSTIAMIGFWCTGILLVLYLFHIIEKLYKIPWLKFEFIFCIIMTLFYFIMSILAVTFNNVFYEIAGVFGFICMVAYGLDAFLKFRGIRNGELAQGERVVSKQTTTTTY
ncbi:hypothetical protein QE152_g10540 [Popillia japonica]|uniref:MARVEL domain-containing protein n=1 Tax=Popillia japonica TaxID=7064 RepID=A0AAW1LQU4_POPJA